MYYSVNLVVIEEATLHEKTPLEELASYTLMFSGLAIDKEVDYGTGQSQPLTSL